MVMMNESFLHIRIVICLIKLIKRSMRSFFCFGINRNLDLFHFLDFLEG